MPTAWAWLARDGQATCAIVASVDAAAPERTTVNELADYLDKVTGTRPAVGTEPVDGTNIYVGRAEEIHSMLGEVDWAALSTDGIVMRTIGDELRIHAEEAATHGPQTAHQEGTRNLRQTRRHVRTDFWSDQTGPRLSPVSVAWVGQDAR